MTASSGGAVCSRFIVHARIARLRGLDPKQNRSIPPLRYDDDYRLKREFGHRIVVDATVSVEGLSAPNCP